MTRNTAKLQPSGSFEHSATNTVVSKCESTVDNHMLLAKDTTHQG